MLFLFICSFLGGIGYKLTWEGLVRYGIDNYKEAQLERKDSWKYLTRLDNLSLIVAFPLTGLVISDYRSFVNLNMSISMVVMMLYAALSRPTKEKREYIS